MIIKTTPSEKSLGFKGDCKILCCYTNTSSKIQVIQVRNIPIYHWKRVVFPNQRLMFEAGAEDSLEVIKRGNLADTEVICCRNLQVKTCQDEG
ncbi:MAG: DUF1830 domain-containing protein [Coleofasciculaceae cyanobacterium]